MSVPSASMATRDVWAISFAPESLALLRWLKNAGIAMAARIPDDDHDGQDLDEGETLFAIAHPFTERLRHLF